MIATYFEQMQGEFQLLPAIQFLWDIEGNDGGAIELAWLWWCLGVAVGPQD